MNLMFWKLLQFVTVGVLLCIPVYNYFLWINKEIEIRPLIKYNLLSILILIFVLVLFRKQKFWPRKIFENKWQIAGFLAVLIVGIFARTLFLDKYPPPTGQYIEEFQTGVWGFFPVVDLFAMIGIKFFGPTMYGMRLIFVLLSYLSIVFFYIASRLFLKTYLGAIFATGLFAASDFLASSSRIAVEWYTPITTFSLALAALFLACNRRDWSAFAIAGLLFGTALLEYQVYKFVLLLCLLWFLFSLITEKSEPYCNARSKKLRILNLWKYLPHITIMFLMITLAFLPELPPNDHLGWFSESYYRHKDAKEREQKNWTFEQINFAFLNRLKVNFELIFLRTEGILNYYTGLLAVVAMIYCMVFISSSHAKVLPVFVILISLIAAAVVASDTQVHYLAPLLPIFFLAIGILIDDFAQIFKNKIAIYSVIALLIVLMTLNLYNFFILDINDKGMQMKFYDISTILADKMASLQKDNNLTITLVSDRDHLGTGHGYGWMYNASRVRRVTSKEQLLNVTGYVLAHEQYVYLVNQTFPPGSCKISKTMFDIHQIAVCEVNLTIK